MRIKHRALTSHTHTAAKMKSTDEDAEQVELFSTAGGKARWYGHFGEQFSSFFYFNFFYFLNVSFIYF